MLHRYLVVIKNSCFDDEEYRIIFHTYEEAVACAENYSKKLGTDAFLYTFVDVKTFKGGKIAA